MVMFASKCGGKLGKRMYKRIDRMYDSRDGGYVFYGTFWNMFFFTKCFVPIINVHGSS